MRSRGLARLVSRAPERQTQLELSEMPHVMASALQLYSTREDATTINLAGACRRISSYFVTPPTSHDSRRRSPFPCYDCRPSKLYTRSFHHCFAFRSLLQNQRTASKPLNAFIHLHQRESYISQGHTTTNEHTKSRDYGTKTSYSRVREDAADSWVRLPESAGLETCDWKLTHAQQILWKPWRTTGSGTAIEVEVLKGRSQEGRSD